MCDYDDCFDGLDCEDWLIIGPMAEDLADEEIRRQQLEQDLFDQKNELPY